MRVLVAWRIITHEKLQSALASAGIFIAMLMIFLQLGFYSSVPAGGMVVYDKMRFDLMLTSSAYYYQGQSFVFPRRRLYQALALPEVASAAPVYQGAAQWLNPGSRIRRDVFVFGFDVQDQVFLAPDIERQLDLIGRPDVVLVDSATRPMFGTLTAGRHVEINDRDIEIGGSYELGTGFTGLGVVVTSDLNFSRIFPTRPLSDVSLGAIVLRPGSDPNLVAERLRALLAPDTSVFTRAELANREIAYWVGATSTGLVFGFGAVVSVVVGTVILYQILATQIRRHLAQYAVLRAIGYRDGYLDSIVVILALTMATIAYIPASLAAIVIYHVVRGMTLLPLAMTVERLAAVLLIALAMSVGAALVSARTLRRADPVDLF